MAHALALVAFGALVALGVHVWRAIREHVGTSTRQR